MNNKLILMGYVATDPELRYTSDGQPVANYRLAVDRRDKGKNTDFFQCAAWGKGGEFAQKYLKKGTKVLVEGALQTEEWTDKQGVKRTGFKINVISHEFCEKKEQELPVQSEFVDISEGGEELPFRF